MGLALCAGSLMACGDESTANTQLILVADTDIPRVNEVEFTVEAEGVEPQSARATYGADRAPVYLTLVRDDGPLGPLTVRARGRVGSDVAISRTHVVSFVPDRTLVVPLHLARTCMNRSCAPSETCGETGCVAQQLDPAQLSAWSGQAPRLAASMMGDTSCGESAVVDLQTHAKHCGTCNNACKPNELCSAGQCAKK